MSNDESLLRRLVLLGLLFSPCTLPAQCTPGLGGASPVQEAYEQHRWADVVRLAQSGAEHPADLSFDYGMALAHLQRWPEARSALLAGEHQCPAQKRFPIELAGVAFEQKSYPEAARWLRKALKLDPSDSYADNFAGTVYYLMGNLDAALFDWNRVQKPQVTALRLDPHLHVQRLILDRAFAFSPAAILKESELEATEMRLRGLGIFPTFNIALSARPDERFDAELNAQESDGFGSSRLQALVSTFAGTPYQTVYPRYFNIRGSAMNFDSLLRWDEQKRRAWFSLSAPLHELPQKRWDLSADLRDENWAVLDPFRGSNLALGSLNLQRQTLSGQITSFASGRMIWAAGAELSHRSYRNVVLGPGLAANSILPGYEIKQLASIKSKILDAPERRFSLTAGADSDLARLWAAPPDSPRLFEKLQGSAAAHWFPQAQGDRYEIAPRVRGGGTFGSGPFDELFILGEERDNDLWLRGQLGTRDGRKGASPLGADYLLTNTDFLRRLYSNGLFAVKVGPWLDIGRADGAPSAYPRGWLFDTGIQAKLTVLGTSVVLTYGRDLRSGKNAFYGTAAESPASQF